jgi:hypothetical protein
MKQYQKDIWDSFKGVFSILLVLTVVVGGFITLAAGPSAGMAFVLSLFVPILVVSIAVSVSAGIRVNS